MIRKLILTNFGRFREREFPLGPVTLFFGANESGKSTLFDSLAENLCRFRRASPVKRTLDWRYGKERESRLVWEEKTEPAPLAEDHFLSIFAVRHGDIPITADPQQPWMKEVQAQLFSGGIDPALPAEGLEERCSDDGRKQAKKDLTAARDRVSRIQEALAELQAKRREGKGRQDRITALRRRLAELESEEKQLADEAERTARLAEQADRWAELRRLREILRRMEIRRTAEAQLKEQPEIPGEVWRRAEEMEAEQKRLQEEVRNQTAQGQYRRTKMEELRERLAAEEKADGRTAAAGGNPMEELRARRDREITARKAKQRNTVILGSVLLGLLTGAALYFSGTAVPAAAGTAGALAAAGILGGILLAGRRLSRRAEGAVVQDLQFFWGQLSRDGDPLKGSTLEQIEAELRQREEEQREREQRIRSLREQLEGYDREEKTAQRKLGETRESLDAAESRLRSLWREAGYASGEEARRGAERRQTLLRERQEQDAYLDSQYQSESENAAGSWQGMAEEWRRGYEALSRELQGTQEITRQEGSRWSREREAVSRRLEEKRGEKREVSGELSRLEGEFQGAGAGLAGEIRKQEESLQRAEQELEQLYRDRQAAELAAGIFRSLAQDSRAQFARLAEALSEGYQRFTGIDGPLRMESLDLSAGQVSDGQGRLCQPEALSEGTRDAFYLSARLTLAEQSAEASPLILDDPFLTLDENRRGRAVEAVRDFHQRTGRQIIFLTKDRGLYKDVESAFPQAVLNKL